MRPAYRDLRMPGRLKQARPKNRGRRGEGVADETALRDEGSDRAQAREDPVDARERPWRSIPTVAGRHSRRGFRDARLYALALDLDRRLRRKSCPRGVSFPI